MSTANLDAAILETLDKLDDSAPAAAPAPPAGFEVFTKTAAAAVASDRPAPYVAALPCRDLFVDNTYQRDLDARRVARMVAEFDSTLLGVLEVSDRGDGTYAVLEGQHRWAATSSAKGADHHVVCQVHRELTVEDEARVFYEIDRRRKALSGWDRWKARRGSGDALVVEIESIVAVAGLRIDMAPKDGNIRATVALERTMQLGGRPLLTSTLAILGAAYRTKVDAYDGTIIQGLSLVLHHYRVDVELSTERLVAALQGIPPRQLKARAAAMREAVAGEVTKLTGAVIIRAYNEQPGRNVPPFLERIKPHGKLRAPRREDDQS